MVWQLNRNKILNYEGKASKSLCNNYSKPSTQQLIADKSIFKAWFNFNK